MRGEGEGGGGGRELRGEEEEVGRGERGRVGGLVSRGERRGGGVSRRR